MIITKSSGTCTRFLAIDADGFKGIEFRSLKTSGTQWVRYNEFKEAAESTNVTVEDLEAYKTAFLSDDNETLTYLALKYN